MASYPDKKNSARLKTFFGELRRRRIIFYYININFEKISKNECTCSGNLDIKKVTHLVVNVGPRSPIAAHAYTEKLQRAVEAGLPIVSFEWLLESSKFGRFLDIESFLAGPSALMPTNASCTDSVGFCQSPLINSPAEKLRGAADGNSMHEISSLLNFVDINGRHPGSLENSLNNEPTDNHNGAQVTEHTISCVHLSSFGHLTGISNRKEVDPYALEQSHRRNLASPHIGPQIHMNALFDETKVTSPKLEGKGSICINKNILQSNEKARSQFVGCSVQPLSLPSLGNSAGDIGQPSPSNMSSSRSQTSKVIVGPCIACKPTSYVLKSLRGHHGHLSTRKLRFYASASVYTVCGQSIHFIAGETIHGATMLYDIDSQDGKSIFARALIKMIYTVDEDEEVYMLHHYLLDADDVAKRPAWQTALQSETIEDGELLLSAQP